MDPYQGTIQLMATAYVVWGKIMFSQACVILSTGPQLCTGEGAVSQTPQEGRPPNPSPRKDEMGIRKCAVGMHPTGMDSCFIPIQC